MAKYNETFSQLVRNSHDMYGYIAYCLYKKDKQEFIQKRLKEHNAGKLGSDKMESLPQEEIDAFVASATTSTSIDTYRTKANQIISEFLYATLHEEIDKAERDILSDYKENVKSVLPPWWHGVLASIAASLIVSVGIALFMFLGRTSDKWIGDIVDHAIEKAETSKNIATPSSSDTISANHADQRK